MGSKLNASNRLSAVYISAILTAVCFAFFIAATITTLSPTLALATGVLIVVLFASKKYPFLPILIITLVICDIVPIPKGGRLYFVTIIFCSALSITFSLLKKRVPIQITAWAWLSLAIYAIMIFWGYLYGVKYLQNNSLFALGESQQILALLIFPALLICFDEHNTAAKIIRLTAAIGMIIGIASIFQYATGISLGGRVEQLETLGSVDSNITRATIPGKLFLLFCLFLLLPKITRTGTGIMRTGVIFVSILILCFALLVSFGRALWACAFIGVFISASFFGFKYFFKLAIVLLFVCAFSLSLIAIVSPNVYDAAVDRALSVTEEGRSTSSFGWRLSENEFASKAINKSPLLGIGLGGEYKPPLIANALFPNQTSFIHNGYYFILLKFGYLGVLLFMGFVFSVWRSVFSVPKGDNSEEKRAYLGAATGTLLAALLLSFTQPEILSPAFLSLLSFLIAISSAMRQE